MKLTMSSMRRTLPFNEPQETRFFEDIMHGIEENASLRDQANETLQAFAKISAMAKMYACPQTPVYHAEGPFVIDHVRLILVSLYAIVNNQFEVTQIEELHRVKECVGEIEEMGEIIKENAATFEVFALCHDLGKPLTLSFASRPGSDGYSRGFYSAQKDLWHPGHALDKQKHLLRDYKKLYELFAQTHTELDARECESQFFSAYQIDIHYHGHAHAIFHPRMQSVIKKIAKEKRLSDEDTQDLFLLIDVHIQAVEAFASGVNISGYERLVAYAQKKGRDVDDFLDKLQACVFLDVVCGSLRRDAHHRWHQVELMEFFLRSEYAAFPLRQQETLHKREQKEKERLQKRFHDFLLDGTAIMTLLGSKPGAEFGAQLKGIQEAALGKGDLPFFPDEIRRELERRMLLFR